MTAHCPTDLRQENPRTESCPAATAESGRLGTVIHFCLAPDGGVWSHIRLLAAHQRPQWRVMVVAVSRGAPRKEVFAEAEACCDRSLIDTRPAITGIYYL